MDIQIEKVNIPIRGMTCASCVQTVENALKKQKGVIKVNVKLATEKALVEYDSGEIDLNGLGKAISDTGYIPVISKKGTEKREVLLKIVGMTCSACAATIEKSIRSLEDARAYRIRG